MTEAVLRALVLALKVDGKEVEEIDRVSRSSESRAG